MGNHSQGPPRRPMQQMQVVDLICIGRLMLCLATGDPNAPRQATSALRMVEGRYGLGLSRMISRLLVHNQYGGVVSAAQLCSEAGIHLAQEVGADCYVCGIVWCCCSLSIPL